MLEENIIIVTDFITDRIGFTINNLSSAMELLMRYDESTTKKVIDMTHGNGILNSELIFN